MEILLSILSKIDGSVREIKSTLGDGLIIGRGAEKGVLLDGVDLSREHLVLTTDGTNVYVTDLSSNGTWLNGTRLRRSARTRVVVGDSIELPDYVLTFRLARQPNETGEIAIAQPQPPQMLTYDGPMAPARSEKVGSMGMFDPVFRFVGSITFMEKFLVLAGLGGLAWLYAYLA
jgi:predicted component of type VI protein secretion system